ncbi:MAG: site-specific DNA-methyltransferase [Planctomycetaceae bacterium]|jgi:site-specific DNA-methyltransferase (adenine-specific)|nr:site-specific DNA-methyltransferase [Planctomycetaceae bacterium]
MFYNEDCITGATKHLADNSLDLIITDPPYGIGGDKLDKHYNRDESKVIDGYVEVAAADYPAFTNDWIQQAARVLKPGGSLYVVSGYTNLRHILNALAETEMEEVNHLIWKYNFGVYTSKKYISSHYHLLYYAKPGGKRTFNTFAFYADSEKSENGGSLNYLDREDVLIINREYKPGQIKNKNELPSTLLTKMIMYSSNQGDLVGDFFLGSFSTAKVAIGLGRRSCGFELNRLAFTHQIGEVAKIEYGCLLRSLRTPPKNKIVNRGKTLTNEEKEAIVAEYLSLIANGFNKKNSIERISEKFGRGYWSILQMVDNGTLTYSINSPVVASSPAQQVILPFD